MVHRFSCPMTCGIFLDQGLNGVPCIARQIINHWTTREVPQNYFYTGVSSNRRSQWHPHSSTLAWKIPWTDEPGGLWSLGSQSWTRLSDFTFTFHFYALEKEMATHSSVLAWRIPGTGEPGGLPSMGSHRV